MSSLLALSGSPSPTSRTARLLQLVATHLAARGHDVDLRALRDLPPGPLLAGDTGHPEIRDLVDAVDAADAVIVASPVYKASYTGLLKAALDLLPQYALAGKSVLPLATGGSVAHVLAIDYALRPVLVSLGAAHVSQGWFVLDRTIEPLPAGSARLTPEAADALWPVVDGFADRLDLGRVPTGVPAPANVRPLAV